MNSNPVIIYQPWGGLGDNLAHSPLAKLCYLSGRKCFLHKDNATRNKEIYDLVWKRNIYIDAEEATGFPPNFLDMIKPFEQPGVNHLQVIQKAWGFPGDILYPDIYLFPIMIDTFKGSTVVDFTSISVEYDEQRLWDGFLRRCCSDKVFVIVPKSQTTKRIGKFPHWCIPLTPDSLVYYCHVISSCSQFYCLNSGMSHVASALKHKHDLEVNITTFTYRKYTKESGTSGYFYPNNNYVTLD